MSILEHLSTSLGRRDEVPNQELARQIAEKKDKNAVKELVVNLHNKSKDIQHDCIKVLYEIGLLQPALIIAYGKDFIALLASKNNRMQWGAMTALNSITLEDPDFIYSNLGKIISAANKGSVITRDHCVFLLTKLCSNKKYADDAFTLLIELILTSPANQLPMYAEHSMPLVNEKNKSLFIKTLSARLHDIDKDTKRKRIEKVIKKVS